MILVFPNLLIFTVNTKTYQLRNLYSYFLEIKLSGTKLFGTKISTAKAEPVLFHGNHSGGLLT